MPKRYQHLNLTERTLIAGWRHEQLSLREIARRLQRSHTSISRELRRNPWSGGPYWPPGAQILARARLQNRAARERLKSKHVRAYVHQQLPKGAGHRNLSRVAYTDSRSCPRCAMKLFTNIFMGSPRT